LTPPWCRRFTLRPSAAPATPGTCAYTADARPPEAPPPPPPPWKSHGRAHEIFAGIVATTRTGDATFSAGWRSTEFEGAPAKPPTCAVKDTVCSTPAAGQVPLPHEHSMTNPVPTYASESCSMGPLLAAAPRPDLLTYDSGAELVKLTSSAFPISASACTPDVRPPLLPPPPPPPWHPPDGSTQKHTSACVLATPRTHAYTPDDRPPEAPLPPPPPWQSDDSSLAISADSAALVRTGAVSCPAGSGPTELESAPANTHAVDDTSVGSPQAGPAAPRLPTPHLCSVGNPVLKSATCSKSDVHDPTGPGTPCNVPLTHESVVVLSSLGKPSRRLLGAGPSVQASSYVLPAGPMQLPARASECAEDAITRRQPSLSLSVSIRPAATMSRSASAFPVQSVQEGMKGAVHAPVSARLCAPVVRPPVRPPPPPPPWQMSDLQATTNAESASGRGEMDVRVRSSGCMTGLPAAQTPATAVRLAGTLPPVVVHMDTISSASAPDTLTKHVGRQASSKLSTCSVRSVLPSFCATDHANATSGASTHLLLSAPAHALSSLALVSESPDRGTGLTDAVGEPPPTQQLRVSTQWMYMDVVAALKPAVSVFLPLPPPEPPPSQLIA
jgi:hypothetical protein